MQPILAFVFLLAAAAAQAPLAVELTCKDKPPIAATWAPPALALDTDADLLRVEVVRGHATVAAVTGAGVAMLPPRERFPRRRG